MVWESLSWSVYLAEAPWFWSFHNTCGPGPLRSEKPISRSRRDFSRWGADGLKEAHCTLNLQAIHNWSAYTHLFHKYRA